MPLASAWLPSTPCQWESAWRFLDKQIGNELHRILLRSLSTWQMEEPNITDSLLCFLALGFYRDDACACQRSRLIYMGTGNAPMRVKHLLTTTTTATTVTTTITNAFWNSSISRCVYWREIQVLKLCDRNLPFVTKRISSSWQVEVGEKLFWIYLSNCEEVLICRERNQGNSTQITKIILFTKYSFIGSIL